MTFLGLFSAPSALEAAWILFVVCGCVASGWALGFGMGYRRGVDDAATRDGIGADQPPSRGIEESPAATGLSSQHDAPTRLTARSPIREGSRQPSESRQ
jgi:hypothetical protein